MDRDLPPMESTAIPPAQRRFSSRMLMDLAYEWCLPAGAGQQPGTRGVEWGAVTEGRIKKEEERKKNKKSLLVGDDCFSFDSESWMRTVGVCELCEFCAGSESALGSERRDSELRPIRRLRDSMFSDSPSIQ